MLAFLLKVHFYLLRTYLFHVIVSWRSNIWKLPLRWSNIFTCENNLFTGLWPHTEFLPVTKGTTMCCSGYPHGISILETLRSTHVFNMRSLISGDRIPSPIWLSSREINPQNPNFIWGRGRCLKFFWCDDILAVQKYISLGWILKYTVVKWHVWGLLSHTLENKR